MQLRNPSRILFAVTMIAIGIIGLIRGSFAGIWGPVPDATPGRDFLVYLCAFVSLACGAGLLTRRTAGPAALALLVFFVIWTAWFRVPFIIRAPLVEVSYQTNGESAVLIAAAWALHAEFAKARRLLAGELGLRIAHVLYGLALIAFGISHFAYLNMTVPLVPHWLPGPLFWAYFTGAGYVAAGVDLATGIAARLGATLAAVQITLITLLVWGPMVLAGDMTPGNLAETIVSWALTAGAWVLAASFESRPWFERPRAVVLPS